MAENAYYARVDYIYDGGDKIFSIPFNYIKDNHVVIIINGDEENPNTDFTYLTASSIQLNTELISGDRISIRRTTPLDERIVIFEDNNVLDEESQNLSADQVFKAMQEVTDAQNALNSSMRDFVLLKEYVDTVLANISETADAARNAIIMDSETRNLINDISNTYQNLQNKVNQGLTCHITHNLFDIIERDSTLSDDESLGLKLQNSNVNYSDYPDAYSQILNEYENGVDTVYLDNEVEVYTHSYEGGSTGVFYLPSNKTLEVGETLYSDGACSLELGEVTSLSSVEADKYSLGASSNNFYVPKNTLLIAGSTTVYTDSSLLIEAGIITDLKHVNANSYVLSSTGTIYVNADEQFRVGKTVYSDSALTNSVGVITKLGEVNSDQYKIAGLEDIDTFYVPEGTVIKAGTIIYEDAACTVPYATIATKGSISSNGSYYYSCSAQYRGSSWVETCKFYTTRPISKSYDCVMYQNAACTKKYIYGDKSISVIGYVGSSLIIHDNSAPYTDCWNLKLLSSADSNVSSYVTIGSDTTKLTYYKQATVKGEVIAIDNGSNQTYEQSNSVSKDYIKIGTGSYLVYGKTGTITTGTIKIDSNNIETLIDKGIVSSQGTAFIYKLASNGHKIVDNIYTSQISGLKGFYILNQESENFKLPLIDEDKIIYFCVGNTILVKSGMSGISRNEVLEILNNYVTNSDIRGVINNFNSALNNFSNTLDGLVARTDVYTKSEINAMFGDMSNILDEIIGE